MKLFVSFVILAVAYCSEIISKDITESLTKVAKWQIIPYGSNPLRFKSRYSFERDLRFSFNFENKVISNQENLFKSQHLIGEKEEFDLFNNSSESKCSTNITYSQYCPKVNAIKAVLKTIEYINCALDGVEIKYNPWGKIFLIEDTLTCSNKFIGGCKLSYDILSIYDIEMWEEALNKSVNYESQDLNECTPFCLNLNTPSTIQDRLNITLIKGDPLQLIKEGYLVLLDSNFSIYEDMLYYKDGVYSYILGEEIFRSFFIAYGYKRERERNIIYGFTFIPSRGIVKLKVLFDEIFERGYASNNSSFISIKKNNK